MNERNRSTSFYTRPIESVQKKQTKQTKIQTDILMIMAVNVYSYGGIQCHIHYNRDINQNETIIVCRLLFRLLFFCFHF